MAQGSLEVLRKKGDHTAATQTINTHVGRADRMYLVVVSREMISFSLTSLFSQNTLERA